MEKNKPPAAPAPMLERTISMEEPKTLSQSQLAFLRESALKVINSNTPEEARRLLSGKVETSGTTGAKAVEPADKADK